jgi:hypothetical protein
VQKHEPTTYWRWLFDRHIVSTAMPTSWNKAAYAQLKLKIAQGLVPTNPAELTNDCIYNTLSAVHFKEYHLTGPTGQASVI